MEPSGATPPAAAGRWPARRGLWPTPQQARRPEPPTFRPSSRPSVPVVTRRAGWRLPPWSRGRVGPSATERPTAVITSPACQLWPAARMDVGQTHSPWSCASTERSIAHRQSGRTQAGARMSPYPLGNCRASAPMPFQDAWDVGAELTPDRMRNVWTGEEAGRGCTAAPEWLKPTRLWASTGREQPVIVGATRGFGRSGAARATNVTGKFSRWTCSERLRRHQEAEDAAAGVVVRQDGLAGDGWAVNLAPQALCTPARNARLPRSSGRHVTAGQRHVTAWRSPGRSRSATMQSE